MDRPPFSLVPESSSSISDTVQPAPISVPKRKLTAIACDRCRKRKSKCDGQRPSCTACAQASTSCTYAVGKEETPYTALRRTHQRMATEKSDLENFLSSLRSRSEAEALEIFQRLRNEPDPLSVLRFVKDGDLLLQAASRRTDDAGSSSDHSTISSSAELRQAHKPSSFGEHSVPVPFKRRRALLQSDSSSMLELYHYIHSMPDADVANIVQRIRSSDDPFSVLSFIRNGDPIYQQLLTTPGDKSDQTQVRSLDATALRNSRLQLPARPWTTVGGDGIVSHLISNFFDREYSCLEPYVNEHAFLKDMIAGEVSKAKYCSPLLVNAICALSALSSEDARKFDMVNHGSTRIRFYEEARKLFEGEGGRASLASAQACLTLFVYSSSSAMDRVGLLFRFAGCEMFKRLNLGDDLSNKANKATSQERTKVKRQLRAQISWGLFCSESLIAFAYLQPSLISIPKIPRHFLGRRVEHERFKKYPMSLDEVLDRQCSISEIFNRIVIYYTSPAGELGNPEDLEARKLLYDDALQWQHTIPPQSLYEPHRKFLQSFLQSFFHFAVVVNFRPLLSHDVEPLGDGRSPADICIDHCQGILDQILGLRQLRPSELESGSVMTLYFIYMSVFTLVSMLDTDPASRPAFTKFTAILYQYALYWPAAPTILSGLKALSKQMGVSLPAESSLYFTRASQHPVDGDVPICWAVPQYSNLLELLSDDGTDTMATVMDMGTIIRKWNMLTI